MDVEKVRQIRSPAEAYELAIQYGEYKIKCPLWLLLVKAIFGGYCASLGGHASMVLASAYYNEGQHATAKMAFGIIFSGALICLMFTGSDLVTSNCMNFALLAYSRKISPLDFLIRFGTSISGNFIGAVIGASMLSAGTGFFIEGIGKGSAYMQSLYNFKLSLPFGRVICSAIGCNCYVCLAVWAFYVTLDSAGSILAMVILISSFAVAGFEHIVANFYILHTALFSLPTASAFRVYIYNFLPTFIGNALGGAVIVALPLHLMYGMKRREANTLSTAGTTV